MVRRYLVAVGSVLGALLISHWPLVHLEYAPVSLFLCAVMLSAWFGGVGPGLLAIAFSAPPFLLQLPAPGELIDDETWPDAALLGLYRLRRLASANAQVGLAKTAYYALVNISGSGGFETGTITTLLQGPSALWAVGATVAEAIFDGGRRRALNVPPDGADRLSTGGGQPGGLAGPGTRGWSPGDRGAVCTKVLRPVEYQI